MPENRCSLIRTKTFAPRTYQARVQAAYVTRNDVLVISVDARTVEPIIIKNSLDTSNSILYVKPNDELEKEDFIQLARIVDRYLQRHGSLAGLIIDAPGFPGWDDFSALVSHLRFVKDHHKLIRKLGKLR